MMYARGWPALCFITWFLVALFVVETYHLLLAPYLRTGARLAIAIALFGVAGWFITLRVTPFKDVWFIQEGLLLYAWYLVGLGLRRTQALERIGRLPWMNAVAFVVCTAVLWTTFDLNQGPWKSSEWGNDWRVVLINLSIHGNPLWFAVTTVAGCGATLFLARLLPSIAFFGYMGRHTLILMGLNSLFFTHNHRLVETLPPDGNTLSILAFCSVITIGSLLTCLPVIWLLTRYVPQLVGWPRHVGPLLPALVKDQAE